MSRRNRENGPSQAPASQKRKLMDKNQTVEQKNAVIKGFYDLDEAIKAEGPTALQNDDPTYVEETLNKLEPVFEQASYPSQHLTGVKVMDRVVDIVCEKTASKARDSTWNLGAILKGLLSKYSADDYEDAEEGKTVDWVALGRGGGQAFSSVLTVGFMNGPIAFKVKEKKKIERKKRDEQEVAGDTATANQLRGGGDVSLESKTDTSDRAFAMQKFLPKEPMCYFRFVVNPNSFTETVENTFDLSCNIHKGKAGMVFRNGAPHVIKKMPPTSDKDKGKDPMWVEGQLLIDWTHRDWERVVKELDIKESYLEGRGDRDPTSGLESLEMAAQSAAPRREEQDGEQAGPSQRKRRRKSSQVSRRGKQEKQDSENESGGEEEEASD
eukprot:gb/GEZN01007368.1/.p1 GENE.gb/GEZN01007368.1/~~gb/GEZN01007368.1/.p1  ORF type:complete len:382 (+),score=71.66 gb/GEZN01007368.1/:115-1260(+)